MTVAAAFRHALRCENREKRLKTQGHHLQMTAGMELHHQLVSGFFYDFMIEQLAFWAPKSIYMFVGLVLVAFARWHTAVKWEDTVRSTYGSEHPAPALGLFLCRLSYKTPQTRTEDCSDFTLVENEKRFFVAVSGTDAHVVFRGTVVTDCCDLLTDVLL